MWTDANTFSQKKNAPGAWWSMQLKCPNPLTGSHGEPQRVRGTEPATLVTRKKSLIKRAHMLYAERPGVAVRKAWLSFLVVPLATWNLHSCRSSLGVLPALLPSASLAKKTHTHTKHLSTNWASRQSCYNLGLTHRTLRKNGLCSDRYPEFSAYPARGYLHILISTPREVTGWGLPELVSLCTCPTVSLGYIPGRRKARCGGGSAHIKPIYTSSVLSYSHRMASYNGNLLWIPILTGFWPTWSFALCNWHSTQLLPNGFASPHPRGPSCLGINPTQPQDRLRTTQAVHGMWTAFPQIPRFPISKAATWYYKNRQVIYWETQHVCAALDLPTQTHWVLHIKGFS